MPTNLVMIVCNYLVLITSNTVTLVVILISTGAMLSGSLFLFPSLLFTIPCRPEPRSLTSSLAEKRSGQVNFTNLAMTGTVAQWLTHCAGLLPWV